MPPGILYLIPASLGADGISLPEQARQLAGKLDTFIVENPKSARQYLAQLELRTPLQQLNLLTLDEHTPSESLKGLLKPLLAGKNVGLLSEAGCPAVADPGADLVRLAHLHNIRVVPLVGPSAILLALMASGLNGQRFVFHGYLPVKEDERRRSIADLEKNSKALDQTQIFIEAPYRNQKLLQSLIETCRDTTWLGLATDITLPGESIVTRRIREWRTQLPEINKRPTVFLLYCGD
ncbi:MAG TPA: SAM-dependent methyltransferase [Burkholderiales bacterium]|nr:SAM-dependent methyltransferase [Burkholderiales bacterium]